MIALVAALLAGLGALAVLLSRRWPRGACLAGVIALCAVTAAGVLAPVEGPLAMGGAYLVDEPLLRLWLSALAGSLALLVLVTSLVAPAPGLPLLACAVVAVTALSLTLSEPGAALTLAAGCGILALAGAGSSWRGMFRQSAVVPAAAAGAVFLAPLAATGRETAISAEVIPAILLAGAVILRLGVVPLHLLPLRTARTSPLSMLPLISVWAPFLFGLLAVALATTGPVAELLQAPSARDALAVVGGLTVVLATLAMLLQDDLGGLMGVHAIGDGALVLLALAGGEAVLPALVMWLLVSGLARTALAAWAVAVSSRMGGRRIAETRDWIRRAPLLLPGLVVPLAAGIGWPGSPSFEARWLIVEGAMPGTAALLVAGTSMALAAGYIRLVWAGLRAADESSVRPVTPRRGVTHWGAAGLVLALGALALLTTAGFGVEGFTSAAAAASDWRPFEPR
ncbi:MAG: hypothetical protein M3395_03830 [Chloroflexota bacterium]|nr:hypothetical protein [Chloroflexota bacterium]